MTKCRAVTKLGKPCSARPLAGQDVCIMHSGSGIAAQLGRRGGEARRQQPVLPACDPPKNLQQLQELVSIAISATMTGRLQPKTGNAIASLASVLITLVRSNELKTRIEALEAWRTKLQERRGKLWTT